jgi:hypothetical protein
MSYRPTGKPIRLYIQAVSESYCKECYKMNVGAQYERKTSSHFHVIVSITFSGQAQANQKEERLTPLLKCQPCIQRRKRRGITPPFAPEVYACLRTRDLLFFDQYAPEGDRQELLRQRMLVTSAISLFDDHASTN